jgi:hypothetical protein
MLVHTTHKHTHTHAYKGFRNGLILCASCFPCLVVFYAGTLDEGYICSILTISTKTQRFSLLKFENVNTSMFMERTTVKYQPKASPKITS